MNESTESPIWEKLAFVQQNLKVPKSQDNKFGKYKYRSCEDILQHAKPWLVKAEISLIISDEIILVGDRIYVKATATVSNKSGQLSSSGFAREPNDKKGMDASQITGAASSYARKYALNGLLAIDDTKDADTQDNTATYVAKKSVSNSLVAIPESKYQEVIAFIVKNPKKVEPTIKKLESQYILSPKQVSELRDLSNDATNLQEDYPF